MIINFPDKFFDPNARGKEFYLQMAKSIYNEWNNMNITSFVKGADRYKRNEEYSNGSQSSDRYKEKFQLQDDPETSYMNIDWQVPPILPKFRRIALEKIGRYEFSVIAEAIDPAALLDRDEYESTEIANILMRDALQNQGVDSSVLNSLDETQPRNMDDLRLKMEFTYKHRDAAEMEKRVDAVFRDNKVNEELRHDVRRYLFDCGVCGTRDEYDPQTGRVKIRVLDPSNIGMSPTKDVNFKNCTYFFERVYMTPDDIKAMDQGNIFTDEDLADIAAKFTNKKYGKESYLYQGNVEPYDKATDESYIPVWDIEFKVLNRTVWERRLAPGGDRIGKIDYSNPKNIKKNNEYKIDDQYVWVKVRWIEDTDWVFNFGPVPNLKRPFTLQWDAEPTFHVVAAELQRMETVSMVDNLKPIVDSVIFAWYKLQNVIMTARPKGIAIEIGALEGVEMGTTNLDPMELMDMFDNTGRLWYRRTNEDGDSVNYRPIEQLDNGLGNEASEWFGIIDKYFNYIRDMLGFNDFTDASTPNPKSLASVGAMATANTDNALNHIFRGEREMLRRLAESSAIRIHDILMFSDSTYYSFIFNNDVVYDDRKLGEGLERQYGINIVDSGTEEEKRQLMEDMNHALQAGQITIADKEVIKNITNIKQAQMYLSVRVKQNIEEERKYKLMLQEENAKANAEAGVVAEQAKARTLEVEYNKKMELETLKSKLKREEMQLEAELESEGHAINSRIDLAKETVAAAANQELQGMETENQNI